MGSAISSLQKAQDPSQLKSAIDSLSKTEKPLQRTSSRSSCRQEGSYRWCHDSRLRGEVSLIVQLRRIFSLSSSNERNSRSHHQSRRSSCDGDWEVWFFDLQHRLSKQVFCWFFRQRRIFFCDSEMFSPFQKFGRRSLDRHFLWQHSGTQSFFQRTTQLASRRWSLLLHHSTRKRRKLGQVDLKRGFEDSRQQRRSTKEIRNARILEDLPRNGEIRCGMRGKTILWLCYRHAQADCRTRRGINNQCIFF